jgi:hypothetical protein
VYVNTLDIHGIHGPSQEEICFDQIETPSDFLSYIFDLGIFSSQGKAPNRVFHVQTCNQKSQIAKFLNVQITISRKKIIFHSILKKPKLVKKIVFINSILSYRKFCSQNFGNFFEFPKDSSIPSEQRESLKILVA